MARESRAISEQVRNFQFANFGFTESVTPGFFGLVREGGQDSFGTCNYKCCFCAYEFMLGRITELKLFFILYLETSGGKMSPSNLRKSGGQGMEEE